MTNIIIGPGKYVQGKGELSKLGEYISKLGKKSLILISESGLKRVKNDVLNSFNNDESKVIFECFNGECSKKEVDRLIEICNINNCDNIIGIGGGN